jgi:hypothetical protein
MGTRLSVVALMLLLAWPMAAAPTHHSFAAEFDANQPVTLTGTLKRNFFLGATDNAAEGK